MISLLVVIGLQAAGAAEVPNVPNAPKVSEYLDCVSHHAERYARLDEPADVIADVATFQCENLRADAARQLAQISDSKIETLGWKGADRLHGLDHDEQLIESQAKKV